MRTILLAAVLLLCSSLQALNFIEDQRIVVNGEQMDLNIYANKRTSGLNFVPLVFSQSTVSYTDSTVIIYDAPEISIAVNISSRSQYNAPASLFKVRALFKQDVNIHELYLYLDGIANNVSATLKGVDAIKSGRFVDNKTIMPFMDKAVEFTSGNSRFWVVASNYDECEGVEGLTDNRIILYDYRGHFFRYFGPSTSQLLHDCFSLPVGSEFSWSFLLFEEMPSLLSVNRWLGDKPAALCITNDADNEDIPRLMASYYGSNNSGNPKYLNEGFFKHNIPVTNTVFGVNQAALDGLWTTIMEHGNAIGFHTYSPSADNMSLLEQSLLFDMEKFNVRTWIDHALTQNPEDFAYNGANPDSSQCILDILNQSDIDYLWPGDTPPTNPFNVYEEAWRLPHKIYEIRGLNKPIWFYGRTRMEAWEYHSSSSIMVSFKYMMTADNLDKLIADRGLHISYTHFCSSNINSYSSFWTLDTNGDYIIRDDVEDMLEMLEYYRDHRNLWIATSENVFDRMLDIEGVRVVSVEESENSQVQYITIRNGSPRSIEQLSLMYGDEQKIIAEISSGEYRTLAFAADGSEVDDIPQVFIRYADGVLTLKDRDNLVLNPLKVDIYNIRGQKVQTHQLSTQSEQIQIPFADKASGVYFARVNSDHKQYATCRFYIVK